MRNELLRLYALLPPLLDVLAFDIFLKIPIRFGVLAEWFALIVSGLALMSLFLEVEFLEFEPFFRGDS